MPHEEKRDGKLTGFWYGEVDRRHKDGERFRRRFETKEKAEGYEAYVKATGEEPPGLAEGDITGRTFASIAAECRRLEAQRGLCASGRSWSPKISSASQALGGYSAEDLLGILKVVRTLESLSFCAGGGPISAPRSAGGAEVRNA